MKADVYTGFLTNKVKVFSTEKGGKPKSIAGKVIRRALPLLVASLVSCSGGKTSSIAYDETKDDYPFDKKELVVHNAKLADDMEYLSDHDVKGLMTSDDVPMLRDTNFNHLPQNVDNFWEIVKNGVAITNEVQDSSTLSYEQKAEYRITAYKMLSQISKKKGSVDEVDLASYNNLKTFLYFEKVCQYHDKYEKVLGKSQGVIDERAEIFGRYYQDQERLQDKIEKNSDIQKFAKALYSCDERFVLNYNDSIRANAMSREVLEDWLKRENVKDSNLWYYALVDEYDYCNSIAVYRARGNDVRIVLGVDPRGDVGEGLYSPVGTMIIHELQHIMQKKPASKETPEDNYNNDSTVDVKTSHIDNLAMELGPTLYSLALEDGLYKKLHGFGEDEIVNYGKIDLGTHKVDIGETAIWFNKMMKKYPDLNVDALLCEPEVFGHLSSLGKNPIDLAMNNTHGRN